MRESSFSCVIRYKIYFYCIWDQIWEHPFWMNGEEKVSSLSFAPGTILSRLVGWGQVGCYRRGPTYKNREHYFSPIRSPQVVFAEKDMHMSKDKMHSTVFIKVQRPNVCVGAEVWECPAGCLPSSHKQCTLPQLLRSVVHIPVSTFTCVCRLKV